VEFPIDVGPERNTGQMLALRLALPEHDPELSGCGPEIDLESQPRMSRVKLPLFRNLHRHLLASPAAWKAVLRPS
jgi:hypothetical protein